MYIWLNLDFLEKNKKKAKETAISLAAEEGENAMCWEELDFKIEECYIDSDNDTIHVSIDSDLGYFILEIPIELNMLESMVALAVKKLNKVKTLLETIK